jgi:hypothetical protein
MLTYHHSPYGLQFQQPPSLPPMSPNASSPISLPPGMSAQVDGIMASKMGGHMDGNGAPAQDNGPPHNGLDGNNNGADGTFSP